jgi:ABC-type sulfate transport system permease component
MSAPTNHSAARTPHTGSTFRERLMYYAFGVAIGCVMVGMMFSIRAKVARQEQARREAAAAAQSAAPNPAAPDAPNPDSAASP